MTVSGADSVRVRVHLYERCFRQKPVKRVPADEVHVVVQARHRRRTRRCYGRSAVLPDDSDMHHGRERPPLFKHLNLDRRVAEGVAHAPDVSLTAADGRANCDAGGTERRPLSCRKSYGAKDMVESTCLANMLTPWPLTANMTAAEGEHCSRVCVPPCLCQSSARTAAAKGGTKACGGRVESWATRGPASA